MQGNASTVLLSRKRPFPNRDIPACKTESTPVLSAAVRLRLSFIAKNCNYSHSFRIRKLKTALVRLVSGERKETEVALWHFPGLISNQGVVQCVNSLRDLRP